MNRIIAVADILKVSDEDLNWIIREPIALKDTLAQIQAIGPKLVILTRGGAGASALSHDGKWIDVASKQVEVVDTVGAGDAFNAGVLANLCEKRQLTKGALDRIKDYNVEVALGFGARVAAITISRSGATPLAARTTCANNSI